MTCKVFEARKKGDVDYDKAVKVIDLSTIDQELAYYILTEIKILDSISSLS